MEAHRIIISGFFFLVVGGEMAVFAIQLKEGLSHPGLVEGVFCSSDGVRQGHLTKSD